MRHGGNIRPHDVELVDTEQLLLTLGHLAAPFRTDVGHEQHVRAVHIQLEPVGHLLADDRRREGAEAFAELHLEVQYLLRGGRTRIPENGSRAQRPGAELHASLEPADDLIASERVSRHGYYTILVRSRLESCTGDAKACLDVRLRERRTQIAP